MPQREQRIPALPTKFARSRVRVAPTASVRGAMFPVDRFGTQVSKADFLASPGDTYGGAGRLVAAMNSNDPDTISVDTGSYFFGSGLSFPYFNGEAAKEYFVGSAYDAFGLEYRDFRGGMPFLRDYIADCRRRRPGLPPAVMTNFDANGTLLADVVKVRDSRYDVCAPHAPPARKAAPPRTM